MPSIVAKLHLNGKLELTRDRKPWTIRWSPIEDGYMQSNHRMGVPTIVSQEDPIRIVDLFTATKFP